MEFINSLTAYWTQCTSNCKGWFYWFFPKHWRMIWIEDKVNGYQLNEWYIDLEWVFRFYFLTWSMIFGKETLVEVFELRFLSMNSSIFLIISKFLWKTLLFSTMPFETCLLISFCRFVMYISFIFNVSMFFSSGDKISSSVNSRPYSCL